MVVAWSSDTATNCIMIGFFGLWNSIMAIMMVNAVFAPWTRGEFKPQSFILFVFPHWYVGILVPLFIAGYIPAAIVTVVPYFFATIIAFKAG